MSSGSDFARRVQLQGVVLVALTFVVGVLAGGAAERVLASRARPAPPFHEFGELPPPFMRLGLTDQQRSEIAAIFERARPVTDSVLREMMPRLGAINDSIHAEIRRILTPEQVELFDEQFERRGMFGGGPDRRWRMPFPPDSPPGGRGSPRPPGG